MRVELVLNEKQQIAQDFYNISKRGKIVATIYNDGRTIEYCSISAIVKVMNENKFIMFKQDDETQVVIYNTSIIKEIIPL